MCFSSSTLSHVLATTLWVMGFFHSLFRNGTYDIIPEQGSMGEYFPSPEHGPMGEELLPEQSSMEEGSSLCLGAELNKGQELAVSWSKAQRDMLLQAHLKKCKVGMASPNTQ